MILNQFQSETMAEETKAMSIEEIEQPVKVAPIASLPVAIIATGAELGHPLMTGVTAVTPDHLPNLIVTLVAPLMAILVRFINQFLTTLVGLVGASLTPAGGRLLHANDFYTLVLTCASLAVAGAGFGLLKDLVTVFGKLEGRFPLLTGSI